VVSPRRSANPRLIVRCPRVVLQVVVPLPSFSIANQIGHPSNFLLNLTLDLFDGLLRGFLSLPHHIDFSIALGVRL
jgi:hypothetical protein